MTEPNDTDGLEELAEHVRADAVDRDLPDDAPPWAVDLAASVRANHAALEDVRAEREARLRELLDDLAGQIQRNRQRILGMARQKQAGEASKNGSPDAVDGFRARLGGTE